MLKFGIITEVDAAKGLARVRFADVDNIVSGWLPCSAGKTLKEKVSFPFDVNEHVWCLMDSELEHGVIGGAIYSKNELPAIVSSDEFGTAFDNGLTIKYNRVTRTLSVSGAGNVDIDVDGNVKVKGAATAEVEAGSVTVKGESVTIDCPNAQFTGNIAAAGNITAVNISATTISAASVSGTGNATIGGSMTVSGSIETTGDVVVNGVPFATHKHGGVQTGGGVTGTPVP